MIKKVVLASNNAGKVAEIKALLSDLPIELIAQSKFHIETPEETGETFIDNALIKARHAAAVSGLPAMADDSGLSIDALDGAPGVFSARYAGEGASDLDRNHKVLDALKNVPDEKRTAQFHCAIVMVENAEDDSPLLCEGIWPGKILLVPRGNKGFGYDPIFYVPEYDCSAAELEPTIKNRISHRGRAIHQFMSKMEQ